MERRVNEYKQALKLLGKTDKEIDDAVKIFIKSKYPESQSEIISRIKGIPSASEIENKLAREAVSHGIGFIFTQDKSDNALSEPMSEKDKLIIADLFSKQKIFVLLATPAIGIGVNVSIKNMYIPTLYKPESTGETFKMSREIVNVRELTQLINRAGRKPSIPIAGVYVPSEFVEYLSNVIKMTNVDFNEVPAISFSDKISEREFLKHFVLLGLAVKNSSAGNYTIDKMKSTKATRWIPQAINSCFQFLVKNSIDERYEEDRINKLTQDIKKSVVENNALIKFIDNILYKYESLKLKNDIIQYINECKQLDNDLKVKLNELNTRIEESVNTWTTITSDPTLLNQYLIQIQMTPNDSLDRVILRLRAQKLRLETAIIENRHNMYNAVDEVVVRISDLESKNDSRLDPLINNLKKVKNDIEMVYNKQRTLDELRATYRRYETEINQLKIEINNLHNLLNNVNNGNTTIPYSKIELLNNIRDSEHLLLEKQKQLKNLKSYIDILKIKYKLV